MDRCELAFKYHHEGFNCAQSVVLAFEDLTGMSRELALAATGGFGGGVGGSHAELCGAASGAVLVLSLLNPFTDGSDMAAKRNVYAVTKDFRARFEAVFGHTRCGDLLAAKPGVTDKTPAAQRLGVTSHCDNMIVTAVEIVEAMLAEKA